MTLLDKLSEVHARTKTKLSLVFFGLIIAVSFLYYLANASSAPMAYGFDEILMHWPIGAILSEANIQNFTRILIASFFLEDHLYPIGNLVSYLIYSSEHDPIKTMSITTKSLYMLWMFASIYFLKLLYEDRTKIILAIGLIISNQALLYHNSTHLIVNNLVVLFSILTILFIAKYISTKKNKFLIFAYLFMILGTFSFEMFFASYSLILLFSVYKIYLINNSKKHKLLMLIKISLAIAMALIPYLVLHYIQFGTILPSSRLEIISDGDIVKNSLVVGAQIINDIFYGIPKHVFLNFSQAMWLFIPLVIFVYFIRKKIVLFGDQNSNALIFASFFTIPVCMYTGRYWPGMWAFIGIMLLIAFASIIVETLKRFSLNHTKNNFILSLLILIFLSFNLMYPPHKKLTEHTEYIKLTSLAGYEVLNSATNKITIVRLPDAKYLGHPIAFWAGNEIYNGNSGLSYFKDQNIMHIRNAYIETYKNPENKDFSFYEDFFNQNSSDSTILFKNRNSFFAFDNHKSKNTIFRASTFPSTANDKVYDIYFPDFIKKITSGTKLKIELTLNDEVLNLQNIFYSGKAVTDFELDGNKVAFITDDQTTPNQVYAINAETGKNMPIKTINIFSSTTDRQNISSWISPKAKLPSVSTLSVPCIFTLNSKNMQIYTTVSPFTNLEISTFQPVADILKDLDISYWSLHLEKNKRLTRENLKFENSISPNVSCK